MILSVTSGILIIAYYQSDGLTELLAVVFLGVDRVQPFLVHMAYTQALEI